MKNKIGKMKSIDKLTDIDEFDSLCGVDGATEEYVEPDSWSIITALNRVISVAQCSRLSDNFFKTCKNPLGYLRQVLGLTDIQILVLGMLVENGDSMSWKAMANFLDCSRLTMMIHAEEVEELVTKRWLIHKEAYSCGCFDEGFALVPGVLKALSKNQVFVPEKIEGLTEQQFVDRLESHLNKSLPDRHRSFSDDEEWMLQLVKANPSLPLCHEVLKFDDIHMLSLLLLIVFDYAQWEGSEDEGLRLDNIDDVYPEEYDCDFIREKLIGGTHPLILGGYIEHKCEGGMAKNTQYMLTEKTKTELLSAYKPSHSKVKQMRTRQNRFLRGHDDITEKVLFYNESEQKQIERLASMLSPTNLPTIQKRFEEEGQRKGFACLFYGGPGTGKTETVLQLARQTGRDIMQVDISTMRDKYVGETEKNMKAVFTRYRDICRNAEVMPILFFNEADALFNKRSKNTEHSVEKMENAMQNILLQELEDLEGILIATTNLTSNLDPAFERRFIYKVEFHKPNTEVKAKIWKSMLKDISLDDAHKLASHFDFSGGQIENIARKRVVDYILTGKKAALDDIEDYCRAELLTNKKDCRHITGFSA